MNETQMKALLLTIHDMCHRQIMKPVTHDTKDDHIEWGKDLMAEDILDLMETVGVENFLKS